MELLLFIGINSWKNSRRCFIIFSLMSADVFVHFALVFLASINIPLKNRSRKRKRPRNSVSFGSNWESIVITEQKIRTYMPARVRVFSEHGK